MSGTSRKILFVTNKWLDGPNSPIASQYENIIYTFPKDVRAYEYDILALDESFQIYNTHVDQAIQKYCQINPVEIVVIIRMGISDLNPSEECLKWLKNTGKKVCFFWLDSNPWDLQYQYQFKQYIDLNVSWDVASFGGGLYCNPEANHISLWTPESDLIYYPSDQTIDVSFIGSTRYAKRAEYIPYIQDNFPKLNVIGGQREGNLSIFDYGRLIRSSKININFPQHGMGYEQCKGRVFQVIASQSLLLENENASTRSMLSPGQDYVEFSTKEDLLDKIKYYLEHTEERLKIALSGYCMYKYTYHSLYFWNKVLANL